MILLELTSEKNSAPTEAPKERAESTEVWRPTAVPKWGDTGRTQVSARAVGAGAGIVVVEEWQSPRLTGDKKICPSTKTEALWPLYKLL